jgi:hypothetical protein
MNETQMQVHEQSAKSRRNFLRRSAVVVGGGAVAAATLSGQSQNNDLAILNYALTLENLEAAFYNEGLGKYTSNDFSQGTLLSALGPAAVGIAYSYLQKIREHENAHVVTLNTVIKSLGGTPAAPCTYNFGYKTPDEFLKVAAVLENTGVMAYDGAIAQLTNKDLITAGASIATVEARHASYLNLITGSVPFPAAFDTPKTMQEILAAAGPFITACGGTTPPPASATKAVLMPKGQTLYANIPLTLDASTSTSADGKPLTYMVRQTGGPSAALSNANTATPTVQFTGFGIYQFELTVTDSTGNTAKDTTSIDFQGH